MDIRERITIQAPARRVFDFVTRIENYEKYIPGRAGKIVAGTDGEPGMTFEWSTHLLGLRIPAVETVTEREDHRFIRYRGKTLGVPFNTEMRTDDRNGHTELSFRLQYESGMSVMDRLVAPLVRSQARRSARQVKALLEAPDDGVRRRAERTYGFWGRSRLYGPATFVTFLGREAAIRRRCVEALELPSGARVLDLCCGTGRNHRHLEEVVGPTGRITGVDLTQEMLDGARRQADRHGWSNVELIRADAAAVELPPASFDGALSTLGLSVVPDFEQAIARAVASLRPGGRLVICDAVPFSSSIRIVNPLIERVYRRLAVWNPDADLIGALERHTEDVQVQWMNGGSVYIATGTKRTPR